MYLIFSIISLIFSLQAFAGPYSYIDPKREISKKLLKKTLAYFEANKSKFKNQNLIGIIDFSKHSSQKRFYLIDMNRGYVEKYLVAHGRGSDPGDNNSGWAKQFSNIPESWMSSQGVYRTAETYEGKYGYSLKLDGLSNSNSKAREREIVIHPAPYVVPGKKNESIGRSYGCPALDPRYSADVISRIKNGILIYAE